MARLDSVDRMGDILAILRQVQNSGYVSEADEKAPEGAEAPKEEPAEPGSVDQPKIDQKIDDLMTTPKDPAAGQIGLETLGDDLGMDDPAAFKQAFDQLRSGSSIDDPALVGQLANAFVRLMVADASTTQRVLNRLRKMYKSNATA